MASIGKGLKTAWIKSMEAIGNTASNIASSTRTKVDEMNLVNRRRDILSDFGARAYELWQKGEHFPAELEALLAELGSLDEQLNALRTEQLAGVETAETAQPAEEAAEKAAETPVAESNEESKAPENRSDEEIVAEVAEALEQATGEQAE